MSCVKCDEKTKFSCMKCSKEICTDCENIPEDGCGCCGIIACNDCNYVLYDNYVGDFQDSREEYMCRMCIKINSINYDFNITPDIKDCEDNYVKYEIPDININFNYKNIINDVIPKFKDVSSIISDYMNISCFKSKIYCSIFRRMYDMISEIDTKIITEYNSWWRECDINGDIKCYLDTKKYIQSMNFFSEYLKQYKKPRYNTVRSVYFDDTYCDIYETEISIILSNLKFYILPPIKNILKYETIMKCDNEVIKNLQYLVNGYDKFESILNGILKFRTLKECKCGCMVHNLSLHKKSLLHKRKMKDEYLVIKIEK